MKSGVRIINALMQRKADRLMAEAFFSQLKQAWSLYMRDMHMPINPFDENDVFTCPRCGCHEFGTYHESEPLKVLCEGPECTYVGVDTRHVPTKPKTAADIAFDKITDLCGMKSWEYPGQVVRDVAILAGQRDQAVADKESMRVQRDTLQDQAIDLIERLRKHEPDAAPINPFASQDARSVLSDLLAIIHRDGGHRETEVGSEEAAKEAKLVFQLQRVTIKALSDRLERLVKACGMGVPGCVCHIGECTKPAVCFGEFGDGKAGFCCEGHCKHGSESGCHCVRVEEFEP